MASYRIKLSDGVDTIDLYGGSDTQVRDAGFGLLPPNAIVSFIGNPTFDGERLGRARYGNRTISLTIKIVGSSASDLKDNIRSIQRLLNDAKERSLLGFGSQVFLEYQWGDTINDSVFYDVIRGDLVLPRGFQTVTMSGGFTIPDAQLNLTCKPFGRYTEQDIAADTLENSQSPYIIKDSYTVDDDGQHQMNAANDWEGMYWATTSAYTAARAVIKCHRVQDDVLGDITFALYLADGNHKPTGSALASGTRSGNYVSELSTGSSWLGCTFDNAVALSDATEYVLVIHGTSLDADSRLSWRTDGTAGYGGTGARVYSTDGGSSWTVDDTDDFLFAILAEETKANYQDVTTTAVYGDVPAKLYLRLSQATATGTKKVWIAKRSGLRQKDDLWIEGEELSSSTDIVDDGYVWYADTILLSGATGDMHAETYYKNTVGNLAANTEVARLNYTIYDIPRGQFRVLARCMATADDAGDYDRISWGVGWSYGDKTLTPTEANEQYYQCAADSTWEVLDLGVLNIPPIAESDIAIANSFELRLYQYATDLFTQNENYKWSTDWIFLLPLDEGVVIIDSVGTADVIAVDGITDPPNTFILGAINDIEDFPTTVGIPFTLGRESTRIYVLRDDVKGMTFTSDIKYQPRFLVA